MATKKQLEALKKARAAKAKGTTKKATPAKKTTTKRKSLNGSKKMASVKKTTTKRTSKLNGTSKPTIAQIKKAIEKAGVLFVVGHYYNDDFSTLQHDLYDEKIHKALLDKFVEVAKKEKFLNDVAKLVNA